jgi:hypothetical protein
MTEDIDRYLRDQLRSLAPRDDDTADALHALAPRARRARVRRRVGVAAGSAAVALAFVAVVAVGGRGSSPFVETEVPPAGPRDTLDVPTTGGRSATTSTSVPVPDTPPTTGSAPSTPAPPASAPAPTTVPSTPPTSPGASGSVPAPTFTPVTGKVVASPGGSITYDFDGARLTLRSVDPQPGFTPEVAHREADRIEVRFEGDDAESRIEVRVEASGVVESVR